MPDDRYETLAAEETTAAGGMKKARRKLVTCRRHPDRDAPTRFHPTGADYPGAEQRRRVRPSSKPRPPAGAQLRRRSQMADAEAPAPKTRGELDALFLLRDDDAGAAESIGQG